MNAPNLGVVVGTDGSSNSIAAVRWAAREAVFRDVGLTVVHVVPDSDEPSSSEPGGPISDDPASPSVSGADHIITDAVDAARSIDGDVPAIASACPFGGAVSALVEWSKSAQLIAVGCHGRTGRHRRDQGPVSRGLVRHAHCPVAVVHHDEAPAWRSRRPVLVGIDGSRASKLAAAIAFEEAAWRGVDLLAVHVCHDSEAPPSTGHRDPALIRAAEAILKRSLAALQQRHPSVHVQPLIRFSSPSRQLLVQGERAELIVVGSHGRGGVTGTLLGSVGAAVANGARVPVIVARRH